MPNLTPAAKQFILHWGELGTRWGINRTVAQIYALLFISPSPLTAEEIMQDLSIARSNVSTSLKELQGWGIVKVVHVLGDRREYFECMKDVWEMFRTILNERKRREVDPIVQVLHECIAQIEQEKEGDQQALQNLRNLLELFETLTHFYDQLNHMPTSMLIRFARMGDRLAGIVNMLSPQRSE